LPVLFLGPGVAIVAKLLQVVAGKPLTKAGAVASDR
jgi:hypothetical protein